MSYINVENIKENEFYILPYGNDYKVIMKAEANGKLSGVGLQVYYHSNTRNFHYQGSFNACDSHKITKASSEEIRWLIACIKAQSVVELPNINSYEIY